MNQHELLAAFREAGVDDNQFGIATQNLAVPRYPRETVLVLADGPGSRWSITVKERGEQWIEATFDSEEEACAYMYAEVMSQWKQERQQSQ